MDINERMREYFNLKEDKEVDDKEVDEIVKYLTLSIQYEETCKKIFEKERKFIEGINSGILTDKDIKNFERKIQEIKEGLEEMGINPENPLEIPNLESLKKGIKLLEDYEQRGLDPNIFDTNPNLNFTPQKTDEEKEKKEDSLPNPLLLFGEKRKEKHLPKKMRSGEEGKETPLPKKKIFGEEGKEKPLPKKMIFGEEGKEKHLLNKIFLDDESRENFRKMQEYILQNLDPTSMNKVNENDIRGALNEFFLNQEKKIEEQRQPHILKRR